MKNILDDRIFFIGKIYFNKDLVEDLKFLV